MIGVTPPQASKPAEQTCTSAALAAAKIDR
jgi:hypothetical protein